MNKSCLILGTGYCGRFCLKAYPDCDWTSRRESVPEIEKPNKGHLVFDLIKKDTWTNVLKSSSKNVLWSFPAASNAEEETNAVEFYDTHLKGRNVIVYSSTSAYLSKIENELVDETFPLRTEEFRFRTEERLRQRGAMVVHLSGIIGPDRYPKSWYERKLVKNGENILNYIHVNDIVFFTNALFELFTPGERFNLTSADYKKHSKIAEMLNIDAGFVQTNTATTGSKKVSNKKLLEYLNKKDYAFRLYPESEM